MSEKKIIYHDLRDESRIGTLPRCIGRFEERDRIDRIVHRRINNNVLIVGAEGSGKTTLVYWWMSETCRTGKMAGRGLFQFDVQHLRELRDNTAIEKWYAEALSHVPRSVLFIDDFGRAVHRDDVLLESIHRLYKRILKARETHLIITATPQEYAWLEREHPSFVQLFEVITLKEQTTPEYVRILEHSLPRINARHRVLAPTHVFEEIVALAARYPALGTMPQAAIRILDESIALAALDEHRALSTETVARVVEAKTGIPKAQLGNDDRARVKQLEAQLTARVRGQEDAIARITKTLQRAKLGLRNPHRPLGSFLMLGPSGVGKTETAKSVAEILFGRAESFVRFDMSEFQQDHTVQRLIGAPAGYIGFEDGGALTNTLRREPHALVLLDEIEKAHPKVFDIFLQVLDDGRLTSGQNETVDARHAIFMATSNVAVTEILEHSTAGGTFDEAFLKERIMPTLAKTFRLEFINRFDSIVIFKPLTVAGLVEIAQLEITKLENRLTKHHVHFELDPLVIERHITALADPRFGARPIKRFIEETCESLLAESLLS